MMAFVVAMAGMMLPAIAVSQTQKEEFRKTMAIDFERKKNVNAIINLPLFFFASFASDSFRSQQCQTLTLDIKAGLQRNAEDMSANVCSARNEVHSRVIILQCDG